MRYGVFLQTLFDFIIVAFAIFLLVKLINSLRRKEEAKPAAPPPPPRQEVLLEEIRDLLKTADQPSRLTTRHAPRCERARRVRFSGSPAVHATLSSTRMPPYGRNRSTRCQLMCLPCAPLRASSSSMSMK